MSYSQDGTSCNLHFGSPNAGHHGEGNEEQVLEQDLNKIASLMLAIQSPRTLDMSSTAAMECSHG